MHVHKSELGKCGMSHYKLSTGVYGGVPVTQAQTGSVVLSLTSGPPLPSHRSDCSPGRSLRRFILKSPLTGDDMMETGLLNWLCPLSPFTVPLALPLPLASRSFSLPPLCPIPLCLLFVLPVCPPPRSSSSTHRLDVSSTRCQIISQQTLRSVTEDWSCISPGDTSSATPLSLRRQHQIPPGLFDHLKGLY